MKCECGVLIRSYEYMCRACFNRAEGNTTTAIKPNNSIQKNSFAKKLPPGSYTWEECIVWDDGRECSLAAWHLAKAMSATPRDKMFDAQLVKNRDKIGKIKIHDYINQYNYSFYADGASTPQLIIIKDNKLSVDQYSTPYFHD